MVLHLFVWLVLKALAAKAIALQYAVALAAFPGMWEICCY